MKTIKSAALYIALAALVFYLFMLAGYYVNKQALEAQYPLAEPLSGAYSGWNDDEKRVMAGILPKCKEDNASGDQARMKICWVKHAEAIQDDGASSKVLSHLLDKQSMKQK